MKTIQGNFVQNDADGNILSGEIFVDRPGKFYFNYNPSSPIKIIADGNNLAIHNSKLDTWSVYPLHNTDFDMIFSDKRDKIQNSIQRIDVEDAFITIVFKSQSGGQKISLVFDRSSYRLLSWKVIDDLGRSTIVEILNYKENLSLESKIFVIPYDKIHKTR
ncbi:outer membrane lipoprotein carrier protein LolA [Candidatus Liberibacter sp.]|uniref:LolA family protein n=1 Tax=Candidatus Liberibacter sp. TaxID=34022 RepID=UPI002174EB51|nr:outer membrane lipoprotein carrier protein LolA [Candidatus Liberibacter sp.]